MTDSILRISHYIHNSLFTFTFSCFHCCQHFERIQLIHGELTIFQCCKGWRIATLREGDAAGIYDGLPLLVMREFPEMGVAIDHSLVRTLRHVLFIVYMSMSQKIALASVYQQGIGLHDREIEEHLVYFRIAVATHSDNLICQRIQSFYDTLRIDSFRNAVAGTVVDDIPP